MQLSSALTLHRRSLVPRIYSFLNPTVVRGVGRRQRAALVKAAIEQALADAGRCPSSSSGGLQGGRGGITAGRLPQRTSVVAKPIAERSVIGGVGRVGAFEVQVRGESLGVIYRPCVDNLHVRCATGHNWIR